ncbi:hypothetical protein [Leucobacter sp. G161]|uniref:hypothetical protein n=1 Tax=Leucobacter sp. G161 TaxID=663704 RepID=UPI00073BCD8B|nr:hypothetical protein [Leucobacter sp. G161]KUF07679.1 hypothetical protein AUL38_07470 [Leucobacter sp. G161]
MPVIAILAVLLVVYVLRIVIGLFTKPLATLARIGSLLCNLLGLIALTLFGFGVAYQLEWSEVPIELGITVSAGAGVLLFFALSAWFTRSRRRSELRKLQRDYDAVLRSEDRRNQR